MIGKNLLNLFASSRSTTTCTYKCGNACFGEDENSSSNTYFGEITRRSALKAGGLTVLAVGAGSAMAKGTGTAAAQGLSSSSSLFGSSGSSQGGENADQAYRGMQFDAVQPNKEDAIVAPAGYASSVLIAWGDPVIEGAPAFDFDNQTAEAAEKQFGFNNDFAGLIEHPTDPNRLVYMCSHEYTTEPMMFKGYDAANPTEEQFKIGIASHGHTILEVSKVPGSGDLKREFGPLNRRITAATPFELRGPVAGSEYAKTAADPSGRSVFGTLNNCSGGVTPWGTMLSGEENVDQYFGNADNLANADVKAKLKRYGIAGGETERKWERFDASITPNEPNRFGYVVEINPLDPTSTPVKHTAMGRFKHEAGNIYITSDGTVVCYSGDDSRFEYLYKFVSTRKMIPGDIDNNMKILDEGTLYVAKLEGNSPASEIDGSGQLPADGAFDGKGTWIPLVTVPEHGPAVSHVEGMDAVEVCVYTRIAGDKVGATKMDRPEDVQANPVNGKIYAALTNNSYRGATGKADVDESAPIRENKNGLILEMTDDHAGTAFTWNLLLVCGDPAMAYSYFGGFDKTKVSPISCPDNVAFDTYGNLWISTDGNALKSNDGLYAVAVEGARRGEVKCFLTVPAGAETCGPIVTDERVMVNVQHPGESDSATAEAPTSHWPDGGNTQPRPAVVVVFPEHGGKVGIA